LLAVLGYGCYTEITKGKEAGSVLLTILSVGAFSVLHTTGTEQTYVDTVEVEE
jgi:hypothetical protein